MPELSFSSVPRLLSVNQEQFQTNYLKPLKPVVIEELARDWPAIKKWTPDFFKQNYGHKQVRVYDDSFVESGANYMSNSKVMRLDDYINAILSSSNNLRMFLYNIKKEIPEIVNDIELPAIANGFSKKFIFMFFGCKNAVTQMHFDIDMSHVFHTTFHGKKTITLFPYEEAKNLYRHPYTCRSYVDIDKPDYKKFPMLRNAKGYRVVLQPGETLFIPSGYWHHITYDEPGYAVSLRCSQQSFAAQLHGLYNLFFMSSIDRAMNKIAPSSWYQWKAVKAAMLN